MPMIFPSCPSPPFARRYHGEMDREQAEQVINTLKDKRPGMYLVRKSPTVRNQYAVSFIGEGRVRLQCHKGRHHCRYGRPCVCFAYPSASCGRPGVAPPL